MTQNNNIIIESETKTQPPKLGQFCACLISKFKKDNPVVAVLRLHGVIGKISSFKSGLTIESLNDTITKAFEIKKLTALVLSINSPGGSPVQSELIANRIIQLSKEKQIPVYSFVEDVAASGGYWLACAGQEIYSSKSSILGSIGVVSAGFGFVETIKKLGIERRVYTQGKNKSVLDPFTEAKESDITIIRNLQKQIHGHFIDYVKDRRQNKLTQTDEILFNGEFWSGIQAVDFGLIDGIDDMYSFIKRNFTNDVKIEYVNSKKSWIKQKLGLSLNQLSSNITDNIIDVFVQKIEENKYKFK